MLYTYTTAIKKMGKLHDEEFCLTPQTKGTETERGRWNSVGVWSQGPGDHCLCRGASIALEGSSIFFLTRVSRFSQSNQLAAQRSPTWLARTLGQRSSSAFNSRRAPLRSPHFK